MLSLASALKWLAKDVLGLNRIPQVIRSRREVHRRWRRAGAEAERIADPRAAANPPILVYQMSKVGSSTVFYSLKELGLPNPLIHVHFLAEDHLAEIEEWLLTRLPRTRFPDNWFLGKALGKRIRQLGESRSYKIVTLVRDPIARDVSSLFQIPEMATDAVCRADGTYDIERCVETLQARVAGAEACSYPEKWFRRELEAVFGVNVFQHPFDRQRGYQIIHGDNAVVLVLRMEDMDQHMGQGLAELLGLDTEIPRGRKNQRRDTTAALAYSSVLEQLRIPRHICERIYSREYTRHFYADEMIAQFVQKWSGAGSQAHRKK